MGVQHVGISAIELYFPNQCVDQKELEKYDGVSEGKYTIGLGQTRMSFCNDREDIYSMALTVVSTLMQKHNIDPKSIGRLEVGTESILDKSKSVKSVLMQLFQETNTNIEGVDTVNACYGGTNALFNTVNWMESSAWDGRNAIVVAGDIALYRAGNARPSGGAGCVAMLITPEAPLVLESRLRASCMQHVYDFYKPDPRSEYPEVDGQLSLRCYAQAMDSCYRGYLEQEKLLKVHSLEDPVLVSAVSDDAKRLPADGFDYMCFHCPTCKTVQKSYARLFFSDYVKDTKDNAFSAIPPNLGMLDYEQTLTDKSLEKAFMTFASSRFEQRVKPATHVATQCGNMYTASLYAGLCSLLSFVDSNDLQGKRIGMFSYGSGLASTMFSIRVRASTTSIQKSLNLGERLDQRIVQSPEEFNKACTLREKAYLKKNFTPTSSIDNMRVGTYYLISVDHAFRREYAIKTGLEKPTPAQETEAPLFNGISHAPSTLMISKVKTSHIGHIRILQINSPANKNAIGRQLLQELHNQIEEIHNEGAASQTRALIIASASDDIFCAGADLKERGKMTSDETHEFLAALRLTFSRLESLPVPSIACISGYALGGGLELALCCHLRVFSANAVVGLPETRLAVIPGAGGTYRLPSLVGLARARDLIFTGRKVTAQEAFDMGLCNRLVLADSCQLDSSLLAKRTAALNVATELAHEVGRGGPMAMRAVVSALSCPSEKIENLAYESVLRTEDRDEALEAFVQKRPPVFVGA